jgi:Leucine-rich repeat (LRR) protein
LSENKIRRIRGLNGCVHLERLWLDNNKIDHVEGMQNLGNLIELNLAGNHIEIISTGFDMLNSLKDLNLSANRIGNFKEVLNLNRLP